LADSLAKFLKLRDTFFVEEAETANQAILDDWPAELSQDVFQYSYWDRLRGYSDMLVPLSVAAKLAQSLAFPTASRVPKFIWDMKSAWTRLVGKAPGAEVKEFGDALLKCLAWRCEKYVNGPSNTMKAALLDPSQSRFLHSYGVAQEVIEESWNAIVREGMDEYNAVQKAGGHEFDDSDGVIVRGQVSALRNFLKKATVPADSDDPLQFYRDNIYHCVTFAPLACRVATNMLAIPAGEAHSERVWSWAGGFVTKLRNRLADDTLQELVILYDFFQSGRLSWELFKQSFAQALRAAAARK
jgi:hypothetical protein